MHVLMIGVAVIFLLVAAAVAILGENAKATRVSEAWKLLLGLTLVALSRGMTDGNDAFFVPGVGMLFLGIALSVWFLMSFAYQRRSQYA